MKEKAKSLKVTLSAHDSAELKRLAKRRHMTAEQLALQVIRQHTSKRAIERAQRLGRKLAKDLGIKTDEDVYRMFDGE